MVHRGHNYKPAIQAGDRCVMAGGLGYDRCVSLWRRFLAILAQRRRKRRARLGR